MEELKTLKKELLKQVSSAEDEKSLEESRVSILGKKGELSLKMRELGKMSPQERQVAGPLLNETKQEVSDLIEKKAQEFKKEALNKQLKEEYVDITLTSRPKKQGKIHPISQAIDEIIAIFGDMGFELAEGPDIENTFNNFDALNMPVCHPAREKTDTFYMSSNNKDEKVLRCHTSPVQIRTMMSQKPPIKIICPGKAYRVDNDSTHSPMFHQIEGLIVDETGKITMANLKWALEEFLKTFFELGELPMRLRPHCFPFTEPSAEIDVSYTKDSNGNLRIGKGSDWLEVAGCGMVHPKVLENCGIDSKKYQGFAFGFGLDRLVMLKYGMPDIRSFFESDVRWLDHYGFNYLQEPNLVLGKK